MLKTPLRDDNIVFTRYSHLSAALAPACDAGTVVWEADPEGLVAVLGFSTGWPAFSATAIVATSATKAFGQTWCRNAVSIPVIRLTLTKWAPPIVEGLLIGIDTGNVYSIDACTTRRD